MELTFLGTGGSWPSARRNVSSLALKRGSEVVLFDCGEGTQRQFQRSDISYMATSKIFFTHLHGDHILGLPGLMQTMDLNEREDPLEIYGPPGIKRYVSLTMSRPLPGLSYPVEVTEIDDGTTVCFDEYVVVARPKFSKLQQGEAVEAEDGSIVEPEQVLGDPRRGRKITYTGDCRPCEASVELAYRSDVLVHEATFAVESERAHEVGHSTAAQAAWIADKAEVRQLFLTHLSPRYEDPEPVEDEARKVFEGAEVAEDLDTFTVKFPPDEPPEVLEGP
ncbi:ribonuclease Z [Thermoplasmatales archaeon SW_10_69_26]|nr:MAG: ribonuclease Z [Thermoplasmatales archaeon SW_10_69_26]